MKLLTYVQLLPVIDHNSIRWYWNTIDALPVFEDTKQSTYLNAGQITNRKYVE